MKAGSFDLVAGQGPFDPATGKVQGETNQEQTAQCLRNSNAILRAAGCTLDHVVGGTLYLSYEDDYASMNEEWASVFPGPAGPPGRQVVREPPSCRRYPLP